MPPIDHPPAIECAVVEETTADRLQLRGRIVSAGDVSGTYSLHIVKTGSAGSSNLNMNGEFSVRSNVETFVGLANFNIDPGANYLTEFSLRVGENTYGCTAFSGEKK